MPLAVKVQGHALNGFLLLEGPPNSGCFLVVCNVNADHGLAGGSGDQPNFTLETSTGLEGKCASVLMPTARARVRMTR
ncbi:hypothetical protein [Cyanobium sp. ATX 6F1]|uniref:hypothetical protein n=1 Tax=unclassified Cyanobium TaxID=2627006 RepID=UPI0020CC1D82|nr:hypothetical protein [Cyanobium sp. ATX 6F1]MCP9916239.1 hypothetical protein [Cyanobium sp. ATX 6F1]